MNINIIKNEFLQITQFLGGNPDSNIELTITLVLSITVGVLIFMKLAQMMKFPLDNASRTVGAFFFTMFIMIFAGAITNIYVAQHIPTGFLRQSAGALGAILALLAIATPVTCFILKAKYFRVVLLVLLSIIAAGAMTLLTGLTIGAIKHGGKDFDKTRERKDSINKIL